MKNSRIRHANLLTHAVIIGTILTVTICLENDPGFKRWLREKSQRNGEFQLNARRTEEVVEDESLSVDVSFEDILKTVIFLMASWIMAVLSQLIGLPSLVGEITTGFVLGPPFLDFVAFPEAMVLIGSFGLIGLLLDSGINLDIAQLRETGSRAVLLAVTGTILALGVGVGMGYLEDSSDIRSALAIGVAFAPSSFGVASQVLKKGEVLNTPMGQLIVAASVVDDILGLLLLSIMEVLVQDDPKTFDYILPFLSSFGYLIVLGFVGIKIIPIAVEDYILPCFSEENRDFVGFGMLFFLLAAYLPLLYYSGASYLTGAFLAGLSFSQIHSVHAQYVSSGPHLKVWLMRIFFAATIGFQVPIKYFTDGDVLNWGFYYLIPVLAKLPLGFLVPRMQHNLPDDFPYDPYKRDVIITTLAMLCRGEFNFIVASFALNAGVLDSEHYAAVVFAILLSAIFAPLALSKVIRYYSKQFKNFLEGTHKIDRIGNTNDGTRPLFLAIQARTPVTWGIQEKFKKSLENAGLIVIDHRAWHTLGLDAVDITEIFCQDTVTKIRIREAFWSKGSLHHNNESFFDEEDISGSLRGTPKRVISSIKESPSRENLSLLEDKIEEKEDEEEAKEIQSRKEQIRKALVDCLGNAKEEDYLIQVSQWETFVFAGSQMDSVALGPGASRRGETAYRFVTPQIDVTPPTIDEATSREEAPLSISDDEELGRGSIAFTRQRTFSFGQQQGRTGSFSMGNSSDADVTNEEPKLDQDLWDVDDIAHNLTRAGFFMSPLDDTGTQVVTEGCPGEINEEPQRPGHRYTNSHGRQNARHRRVQHHSFDSALLNDFNRDIEAATIKDRLHGYIRP